MSTFSTSFLSSSSVNVAQLKTDIELLPTREALLYFPGGVQSTSGNTTIESQSFTCSADDEVEYSISGTVSASSTSSILQIWSRLDGVNQYTVSKKDLVVGTDGLSEAFELKSLFKNLSAGSHTAEVQLVVTGTGTGYVSNLVLKVTTTKRRS